MTDIPPKRRGFIKDSYSVYSPLERRTRKIAFLAALAEGHSIVDAAALVRVPVHTIYSWRRTDTPFRQAWVQARAQAPLHDRSYPLPPPPTAIVTLHKFDLPEDSDG
jgi:hypothetical protein